MIIQLISLRFELDFFAPKSAVDSNPVETVKWDVK